jgi:hypothetical protein
MSGQPLINPLDATKFREAYMANLDLRARLDDTNLQANKNYIRTGQTPVEPSDFRTSEEKLADVARLRIEVRQRLGEIADGQQANKIAQALTQRELQFYAQQAPEINAILKPRYALGVLADIFIPFLQNYMTDTSSNLGVASGLQQVSGRNMLLSGQNVSRSLARSDDYAELLAEAPELSRAIGNIKRVIPPTDLYDRIATNADADQQQELLQEANNLVSNLPTKTQISKAIDDIRRVKNIRTYNGNRDMNAYGVALEQVRQLIEPTDDALIQASNLASVIGSKAVATKKSAGRKPMVDMRDKEDEDEELGFTTSGKPYAQVFTTAGQVRATGKGELIDKLDKIRKAKRDFIPNPDEWSEIKAYNKKMLQNWVIERLDQIQKIVFPNQGKMKGTGLAVKKPRLDVIDPSSVNWEGGVKATQRFVPFGRYIINTHRLNDDIVAIKRHKGGCLKEFPSTRISNRLGCIIREIVGGGVPTFNDLDDLNDNERAYLHKLAKSSNILERLSIPAPKKSEIDKELNEFEILKGQIIAGNDNKDVIKKFKMLILKLSNKNIIPKPQVRELLFDLTNMGY